MIILQGKGGGTDPAIHQNEIPEQRVKKVPEGSQYLVYETLELDGGLILDGGLCVI